MPREAQWTLGIDSRQVLWWKSEKDFGKRVLRTWLGWNLNWRTESLPGTNHWVMGSHVFLGWLRSWLCVLDGADLWFFTRIQGVVSNGFSPKSANTPGRRIRDTWACRAGRRGKIKRTTAQCLTSRLETRIKESSVRASYWCYNCEWNKSEGCHHTLCMPKLLMRLSASASARTRKVVNYAC